MLEQSLVIGIIFYNSEIASEWLTKLDQEKRIASEVQAMQIQA